MFEQSSSLVNTQILTNLRSFARSENFLPRLLRVFEDHGVLCLDELAAAVQSQDFETISAIAHRWKGSCLNLGASALADRLLRLEKRHSPQLSIPEVYEELAILRELFDLSCKELKSLVSA